MSSLGNGGSIRQSRLVAEEEARPEVGMGEWPEPPPPVPPPKGPVGHDPTSTGTTSVDLLQDKKGFQTEQREKGREDLKKCKHD